MAYLEALEKTEDGVPLNIVLPYFYLTLSMMDELLKAAEHMEPNQLLEWVEVCEKAIQFNNKEMANQLARQILPHVSYYLNEVMQNPWPCHANPPIRIAVQFRTIGTR